MREVAQEVEVVKEVFLGVPECHLRITTGRGAMLQLPLVAFSLGVSHIFFPISPFYILFSISRPSEKTKISVSYPFMGTPCCCSAVGWGPPAAPASTGRTVAGDRQLGRGARPVLLLRARAATSPPKPISKSRVLITTSNRTRIRTFSTLLLLRNLSSTNWNDHLEKDFRCPRQAQVLPCLN